MAPGAGDDALGGPWDDDDDRAGDLTPAEVVALDVADGVYDDPAWLEREYADLAPPEDTEDADAGVSDIVDAGFTHGEPGQSGRGFEAGGAFDRMLPGRELAAVTGMARAVGLDQLSDDEVIGFLGAARRNTSWQQALELAGVAELDARRAGPGGAPGEHVAEEVAAALTLTPRAADGLLALAQGITRLAQVPAALAAGVIDLPRAAVFARELLVLEDELAVRAEALVMPRAPLLTTGKLSAALQRAVLAVDPGAAERRKERAEKDARVEAWAEPGRGTAALAGRDLPAADVIAADKRITAAARWLKAHGAEGGMDWLRSRAYLGFLNGYGLDDLLARLRAQSVGDQDHDASDSNGGAPGAGNGEGTGPDRDSATASGEPLSARSYEPPSSAPVPPGLADLTGSVNLVLPALAWLGLADTPGEITGTPVGGPADAATCRELANALAARGEAQWCLTGVRGRHQGHHGRRAARHPG